ncbi:lysine transporter LysE [Duganella sp. BJB488]|uniref:LysE family transporter n=1 Tax=unclassified Duganella TaxID=2636909 RepID=UPI000E344EDD|nr:MULTISPECIES: LysE family transporter [unclassified Duganella]RFP24519.1 lysine transporter LysE [Duganella sp. BJB489]RFP26879.1 lysine transporter LysE [Duganella sp. BJB488]RFP34389.1 lysine transporter LysE [Duganella sp. BJB480]
MSFATWITFFIAACIIAVSPGSGAVLSMSHGLSFGVRRTTATILGLQSGLMLIFFIAGAGVGSLLLASEVAFSIVKTVGALYLIYLGLSQWRAKVSIDAQQDRAEVVVPAARKRFLTGFLTNATNPKGIIFMVAVLPQFITQGSPLLPQLLILAATMCCIDLVVMHSYAFLASSMQRFFRDAGAVRKQNRVFGGLLMAVGAALFFVKRGGASA